MKIALILIAALTLAGCTTSENTLNATQNKEQTQAPTSNESSYPSIEEVIPVTYSQCIRAALGDPINSKALVAAGFEKRSDQKFVAKLNEQQALWFRDMNLSLVVTYELRSIFGARDGCYIFMQFGNQHLLSFATNLEAIAKQEGYELLKLNDSRGVFFLYDGENALAIGIETTLGGTPWIEITFEKSENFTTKNKSPFSLDFVE